jgi:hypothetical protein
VERGDHGHDLPSLGREIQPILNRLNKLAGGILRGPATCRPARERALTHDLLVHWRMSRGYSMGADTDRPEALHKPDDAWAVDDPGERIQHSSWLDYSKV